MTPTFSEFTEEHYLGTDNETMINKGYMEIKVTCQ